MNVAFDVDDTLYEVVYEFRNGIDIPIRQIPDYDLIHILKWHLRNGDKVFVWSAGGIEYATSICEKLGIESHVKIIEKSLSSAEDHSINLTYDDQAVNLGQFNILVKRSTEI